MPPDAVKCAIAMLGEEITDQGKDDLDGRLQLLHERDEFVTPRINASRKPMRIEA
jgi:hypothetical protein